MGIVSIVLRCNFWLLSVHHPGSFSALNFSLVFSASALRPKIVH